MAELYTRDGHIHTPFCRHGSSDSFEAYIEEAIRLGRREMTFTEHFPLPKYIAPEAFIKECGLLLEEVPEYLESVESIKKKYADKIIIHRGFEVDYVEGKEEEIKQNLERFGAYIEDGLLSVHFVYYKERYYVIDCIEGFEELLEQTGSLKEVYDLYFETVLKSIVCDLGPYKPRRIGHPTLIRIFNQKYPFDYQNEDLFRKIVKALKERNMEVDYNAAGMRKPLCKESYPSGRLLECIKEAKIPLVAGSDAHEVSHMAYLNRLK